MCVHVFTSDHEANEHESGTFTSWSGGMGAVCARQTKHESTASNWMCVQVFRDQPALKPRAQAAVAEQMLTSAT
jgi:hypothetical protein